MYKELEVTEVADQDEMNEKIKRIRDELQNMYKGDGAPFGTVLESIEMLGVIEKKLKDMNAKILMYTMSSCTFFIVISNVNAYVINFQRIAQRRDVFRHLRCIQKEFHHTFSCVFVSFGTE